jgi:hypothetical protein
MADEPSKRPRIPHPAEVTDLATGLHDSGVVNLDAPVRTYLEELRKIKPDSSLLGSYAIAWSSYVIVVKEEPPQPQVEEA